MYITTYIYAQKSSPTFLWVSKIYVKLGVVVKNFKCNYFVENLLLMTKHIQSCHQEGPSRQKLLFRSPVFIKKYHPAGLFLRKISFVKKIGKHVLISLVVIRSYPAAAG